MLSRAGELLKSVNCQYFVSNLCRFSTGSIPTLFRPIKNSLIGEAPSRGIKSREVKLHWAVDGSFDPPVQDVLDRFKRLRWGAFIHPRAGRKKHLYRKNAALVAKTGEHILTNRATSFLLDNMVNKSWRNPKTYPQDIYEPYHKRTGVPWDYHLQKPRFFP